MAVNINQVRVFEKKLTFWCLKFLSQNVLNSDVRRTRHFREWAKAPMSYTRLMELPLTHLMLQPSREDKVLDIASPKLLALFYALKGNDVVATDLEDYFLGDFDVFSKVSGRKLKSHTLDATQAKAYDAGSFDKCFSISVFEHIPGNGDTIAMAEVARLLKPGGSFVLSVPVHARHMEEWISDAPYWQTITDKDARSFFQRRYDHFTFKERLSAVDIRLADHVLIAEQPLRELQLGTDGRLRHNAYCIDDVMVSRWINRARRSVGKFPFGQYLSERIVSKRCHYLTTDWSDPNIRQVVARYIKR
jgi:SAM-dependent methyltransferase